MRISWIFPESRRTRGMVNRFHISFWNWVIMLFTVTTRIRLPLPRAMSSLIRIPASRVFPSPTASAIRIRCLGLRRQFPAGTSW